jgi:hypothetical protein
VFGRRLVALRFIDLAEGGDLFPELCLALVDVRKKSLAGLGGDLCFEIFPLFVDDLEFLVAHFPVLLNDILVLREQGIAVGDEDLVGGTHHVYGGIHLGILVVNHVFDLVVEIGQTIEGNSGEYRHQGQYQGKSEGETDANFHVLEVHATSFHDKSNDQQTNDAQSCGKRDGSHSPRTAFCATSALMLG